MTYAGSMLKIQSIVQYADDLSVSVSNLNSVGNALDVINSFSNLAGLKLNLKKSKGIWMGKLKEYGYRMFQNIHWTGKPVKCLGIYLGHDKDACDHLNWHKRLDKVEKVLIQWHKRKLTLYSKVEVIKRYALSKIIYPLSVLSTPTFVNSKLKELFHYYLWGRRDRVKRSNVCQNKKNGGLGMIDVDTFILSLKAAWVERIKYTPGKWCSLFKYELSKLYLNENVLWKTSFRCVKDFPVINQLSTFYQDVIIAFNKAKHIKQFKILNPSDIAQLPLWGCHYFKTNNVCLYLKNCAEHGILYVKDLINQDGTIKSDAQLYNCFRNKTTVLQDIFILKNCVISKIKDKGINIAPYVKIRDLKHIIFKNVCYEIKGSKCSMYYKMLIRNYLTRGNMESVYSKEFVFPNTVKLWENIYKQKTVNIYHPKLREFNYKLLHNIIPSGKQLYKWKKINSDKCKVCGKIEDTKHMLYECPRVNEIWNCISQVLNVNITWKQIICGFPGYEDNVRINMINCIITVVAYAIFKQNSISNFEQLDYSKCRLDLKVKGELNWYSGLLSGFYVSNKQLFISLCDKINNVLVV